MTSSLHDVLFTCLLVPNVLLVSKKHFTLRENSNSVLIFSSSFLPQIHLQTKWEYILQMFLCSQTIGKQKKLFGVHANIRFSLPFSFVTGMNSTNKVSHRSLAYERCMGSEISVCLRDIQNILNDSKLAFAQNEQQLDLLCR